MARRRGIYEISIYGKQLNCSFCHHTRFTHREVYMDLAQSSKSAGDQLVLQSFDCTVCGNIHLFKECMEFDPTLQKDIPSIIYTEVEPR